MSLRWHSRLRALLVAPLALLAGAGGAGGLPSSGAHPVRVNFQPAFLPAPEGYLVDSGEVFGAREEGRRYGWNAPTYELRDRNASASADQRYDTLIHLQRGRNLDAVWELEVPPGTYRVRLVAGDPNTTSAFYSTEVEGVPVLHGAPRPESPWLEGTATVTVADGRLTVRSTPAARHNTLCFLEVAPVR